MASFVHGDLNQVWQVTSFDERWVYAKKVVDGKTGRGRPSKFNRSEVESLIPGGLVEEVKTVPVSEDNQVSDGVNQEEVQVNPEQELVETEPAEVTYVKLD